MRFIFAAIGVIAISLFGIQYSHSQSATPWTTRHHRTCRCCRMTSRDNVFAL